MDKKYKHGLTVGRYQPLHMGHVYLIKKMIEECEKVTVVLGSLEIIRSARHPFIFSERLVMLKNMFSNKIEIVCIDDINNLEAWPGHVLSIVSGIDVFYGGCQEDIYPWDKRSDIKIELVDREKVEVYPFEKMSGTKIRELLERGDSSWKKATPFCNWGIIERGWEEYLMEKEF